ncbi:Com family DNA-binding transcriptional regulator, partial [Mycobacterium tuberculosis]
MQEPKEVRCGHCSKKLAVAIFVRLDIKCPRCGTLNVLRAESPSPERHRASSTPETKDDDARERNDRRRRPAGRVPSGAMDRWQAPPCQA